jgi:hypothetical protein
MSKSRHTEAQMITARSQLEPQHEAYTRLERRSGFALRRLPDHLHKHFARLLRRPNFAREIDARALHAFRSLQAQREAKAVDGGHRSFRRLEARVGVRQKNQRVGVVGIHMRKDARRKRGQRVRGSRLVVVDVDPAHDAETADIIEIGRLQAIEAEIGEIDPVATVRMARYVDFAGRREWPAR